MENNIDYAKPHPLLSFDGVSRFRSIWRAIRRGKASVIGRVYPDRPFNNRKPFPGRFLNEQKKRVYEELKQGRV